MDPSFSLGIGQRYNHFDDDDDDDDSAHTYSTHHYSQMIAKSTGMNRAKTSRLLQECRAMQPNMDKQTSTFPLHPNASIFLRKDEDRIDVFKLLISGPIGTPYFGGLFEFHLYIPDAYPEAPPVINLETTGANQVRFNPNLYSDGKVCLSLLGTWHGGAKTEEWNSATSTLLQLFVSIQSQIMIDEPFFNEPGYERQQGTDEGRQNSARYNDECCTNTLRLAVLEQLRHPPAGFEDVVRNHFKLLGDRIVVQYERWARRAHHRATASNTHDFGLDMQRLLVQLKTELAKLE
eukprot:m.782598 g.782598  ORF g.782598 m.782598 type:complete len:291 (+) comp59152_c1_seq24:3324-4196(+)